MSKKLPLSPMERMNRDRIFSVLQDLGATHVVVGFCGSGDSGQVESVEVTGPNGKVDIDAPSVPPILYQRMWNTWKYVENDYKAVSEHKEEKMLLYEALSSWCEWELDKHGIDWYNNDGGQGEFEIAMGTEEDPEPVIELRVSLNYTASNEYDYQL